MEIKLQYLVPIPDWTPDERPTIPGSPSTPWHPPGRRVAYFIIGILVILTGGLGNALVSANLANIQGELGLTPVEGAWLPAVYVMVNVSANLLLFKARQQYGMRIFAEIGITAYAVVTLMHLFVHNYETAVIIRAVSGFAAAPMSALGIFYVLQAFPKPLMGRGICIALAVTQLPTPFAWILSPSLMDFGTWHPLYTFELGMALCSMAGIFTLKLPPGIRIQVFEKLDFLSFLLFAPALALVAAVLGQGRIQWWTEQPWIAFALIGALMLLLTGFFIEHHRSTPLIQTRWLATSEIIRFALGALSVRFLLAEQTYAAGGLLKTLGMGPDQMQTLYVIILLGTVAGALSAALAFSPKTMIPIILTSITLIMAGAVLDHGISSQTRPHDMYLSQFMIAAAGGMFMGPLMLTGVTKALVKGTPYIVTFAVVFGMTQGMGGLAGSALFGTFQQYREHEYSSQITANVDPADAVVSQRLAMQGQIYARVITDPVLRNAEGVAQLSQIATREANVRAYADVFVLNALIALCFLFWSLFNVIGAARGKRTSSPTTAAASGAPVAV